MLNKNIVWHDHHVSKDERSQIKDQKPCVLWFTGLSGSGKTTIALKMKEKLESLDKNVEIIDGDVMRNNQHKHLGFSRKDIRENNKLIAELVCEKMKELDFVLVPIISPYKKDRVMARAIIGNITSQKNHEVKNFPPKPVCE